MNNKKKAVIAIFAIVAIIFVLFNVVKIQDIVWRALYPKKFETEVSKYAKEYDVDENLIYSIIKAESNFDERAVSRKNACRINAAYVRHSSRYC